MSESAAAPAKINLALVVGPPGAGGKHELVTVYERVALSDHVRVEPAAETEVHGYDADTIVRRALLLLAAPHGWRVHIEKAIPVAAGLGGGSSDAATALRLGNAQLARPLPAERLDELAAQVGADVPFFLHEGPQLGTGDGTCLETVSLPHDYVVLLLLPNGVEKESTAAVYAAFDERGGAAGFAERAERLRSVLAAAERAEDLAALPPNDLASSPFSDRLCELGSFRADVSGAGPAVYGLFRRRADAERAQRALKHAGRTWITVPAWYG
jgi:4-diphosphocytidyl-2-C-methyl-D-erythritol kinase